MKIPVNPEDLGLLIFESVEPDLVYGTQEQRTNEEGLGCFTFHLRRQDSETGKMEGLRVKAYLSKLPKIPIYSPITFAEMYVSTWEFGGKSGITFYGKNPSPLSQRVSNGAE